MERALGWLPLLTELPCQGGVSGPPSTRAPAGKGMGGAPRTPGTVLGPESSDREVPAPSQTRLGGLCAGLGPESCEVNSAGSGSFSRRTHPRLYQDREEKPGGLVPSWPGTTTPTTQPRPPQALGPAALSLLNSSASSWLQPRASFLPGVAPSRGWVHTPPRGSPSPSTHPSN